MRGSSRDTLFFEELDDIDDSDLHDGLLNFLSFEFNSPKALDRALEATQKILSLYKEPIWNCSGSDIPPAAHYRTRNEMLRVTKHPRLVDYLTHSELFDLHPKWPVQLRDHPQAPYRPIVEEFASL